MLQKIFGCAGVIISSSASAPLAVCFLRFVIFKNGSHKALDLRGRSRNMRYHQLRVNQPRNAATLQQWVGQQTSSIPSNHLCAMQYLKFDGDFMRECAGNMPHPKIAPQTLCEPAQSQCT